MSSKIVAIVNGISSKGAKFIKELEYFPLDIKVISSNAAGHAAELALSAAENGSTHILSVGGDGTVNEVLNGIIEARSKDPSLDPILGIIPAGTANDFAHTIGASNDLAELTEALDQSRTRSIDVGLISFPDGQKRYFMNIASIGLGAQVVKNMENSKKPFGADFSFLWAVTRTFLTYKRTSVKCRIDEMEWSGEILAIAIANGKRFGSGIYIAPHAEMDDSLLEVVILGKIRSWDYIKNIGKLKKGKRVEHPEAHYFQGRSISIEAMEGRTMLETDGELIGDLPCKIEVIPGAIKLLIWPSADR